MLFLINYKHLNFEGLYQVYKQACQDFFHLHLDVSRSFIFFIGVPLTSNNSKQNKWQLELKWPLQIRGIRGEGNLCHWMHTTQYSLLPCIFLCVSSTGSDQACLQLTVYIFNLKLFYRLKNILVK